MANVGPLTAEIGLPVWGTPSNFNRFRVLDSLLQRRRSTEVNQTLHDLWWSPGLVHASAKVYGVVQGMELQNFRRRRHLHSAGRPSRWASAHVLVHQEKSGSNKMKKKTVILSFYTCHDYRPTSNAFENEHEASST